MAVRDETKWLEAINKTGFDLEYQVQQILKRHSWHVINNRYYIDDRTGVEREIDVVAYKKNRKDNTMFYTYLIISCKKATESSWVFLTSDHDSCDEDFDRCPIEMLFSDRGIQALLDNEKAVMVEKLNEISSLQSICDAPHRVLAFQQINRKSFKDEDDKRIFSSIITAIKAAAYERKSILELRESDLDICVNFNLLSIFEGGLKENYRNEMTNEVNDIQEIKYINRHIIDDVDRPYRVHFISDTAFELILEQYDQAAEDIADYYTSLQIEVYNDVFSDDKYYRIERAWINFSTELAHEMYETTTNIDVQSYFNNGFITNFHFSGEEEKLIIYWDFSLFTNPDSIVLELNENEQFKEMTSKKLKKFFRYNGAFAFALEPEGFMDKYLKENS